MPRKKKLTLKRIKNTAIEESRKIHNRLRILTIVAYLILILSWVYWKYSIVYLLAALLIAMLARVGAAVWLFKRTFPKEQKAPLPPQKKPSRKKRKRK